MIRATVASSYQKLRLRTIQEEDAKRGDMERTMTRRAETSTPAVNEPEWLTLVDLCELLRIEPSTVYNLRYRQGAPPAVKIGRELRFRRADVEAWLDGLSE